MNANAPITPYQPFYRPTFGIDEKYFPKPAANEGMQTLAMARMYQGIYNRPPQFDLSGVNDVGSGVAKGLMNLANVLAYRRQQNAQDTFLNGLGAQLQEQQDKATRASQALYDMKVAENAAKYQAALNLPGMTPQIVDAQMLGINNPVITAMGDVAGANYKLSQAPTFNNRADVQGQVIPVIPTPDDINRYRTIVGNEPATTLTLAGQYEDLSGKRLGNANTSYQLGVQPTKDSLDITSKRLENEGKRIDNYISSVNAKFAPMVKQAELDASRLGTAQAKQKLQDLLQAQELIKQSVANGDITNPQRLPTLQAQLKALGYDGDLIKTYNDIYNPKSGQSVFFDNGGKPKNLLLPSPKGKAPKGAKGLQLLPSGDYYDPKSGMVYREKQ